MTHDRGRARLGLLVPFTNTNVEPDLYRLVPRGVSVHVARMGGYDADAIPDAGQMQGLGLAELETPLGLLAGARPDVVLYGCTSATLTHGPAFDRALAERIARQTGAASVTAAGALVEALGDLGARRIGFAAPYTADINAAAIGFLQASGFEVVAQAAVSGDLSNDAMGEMQPDAVLKLGLEADNDRADALVLSCTDMRAVEVIEALEQATGRPVVTSNQAMAYVAQKRLGIVPEGPGVLFQRGPRAA